MSCAWSKTDSPQPVNLFIILGIQNLQGGLAENVSRIIVLNLNYGCLTATVCCMMHNLDVSLSVIPCQINAKQI